jgi:hypothetical protein
MPLSTCGTASFSPDGGRLCFCRSAVPYGELVGSEVNDTRRFDKKNAVVRFACAISSLG